MPVQNEKVDICTLPEHSHRSANFLQGQIGTCKFLRLYTSIPGRFLVILHQMLSMKPLGFKCTKYTLIHQQLVP